MVLFMQEKNLDSPYCKICKLQTEILTHTQKYYMFDSRDTVPLNELQTSTMAAASRPKWLPAGPTSARLGTKMAEARLPTMPLARYTMPVRLAPASFSRSRISQYWKTRVMARWKILGNRSEYNRIEKNRTE